MADESANDPGRKMRRLLGGGRPSPMTKLPKKGGISNPAPVRLESEGTRKADEPSSSPSPARATSEFQPRKGNPGLWPLFWTLASLTSMIVNGILVIVLITLLIGLSRSGLSVAKITGLGSGFLGGLYSNFEKMDRAHIITEVQVQSSIPVKFDLQLDQQTNVTLSQDVTINNALVTVNTGGLNITRANTTIVLPQGTTLPIVLNLTVPVDTTVPVTLTVPVDIPMDQTQLHEPFTGLQDVVRPFYCMLSPFAVDLEGRQICE